MIKSIGIGLMILPLLFIEMIFGLYIFATACILGAPVLGLLIYLK